MLDFTTLDMCETTQAADRAYLALVERMDAPDLSLPLAQALAGIADVVRLHAYDFAEVRAGKKAMCSWAQGAKNKVEALDHAYVTRYHRTDPLRALVQRTELPAPGLMAAIEPHHISDPAYRRASFQRFGIRQRLTLLRPVGTRWLALSVSRGGRVFSPGEVKALVAFGRMALPLIAASADRPGSDRQSIPALERRIEAAFPTMPAREREVSARTMIGMTAEAIALDLGVAKSTALTYRRRVYERLGITSAHQLSVLVLR